MLFGGSSVTAGHDNYFEQSYPLVFQRRVASVFEALAVELVVRNIAQGSNNCLPYNLCLNSMGGDDVDWIGWEQSYNCGRYILSITNTTYLYEIIEHVALQCIRVEI